jgi:RNA polymerase sigma factor (sigma-70 family)
MYTRCADSAEPACGDAATTATCSTGLRAACAGDREARQALYAHYLPLLRRWARRWLPRDRCGLNDADDLVQIAMLRTLSRLGEFEVRSDAGFVCYLRQILINEVRAELRRHRRRGEAVEIDENLAAEDDPVVEQMLAHERERAFRRALQHLDRRQREHVALRMESGMSFGEIAQRFGGNADSARMIVARAMRVLTRRVATA